MKPSVNNKSSNFTIIGGTYEDFICGCFANENVTGDMLLLVLLLISSEFTEPFNEEFFIANIQHRFKSKKAIWDAFKGLLEEGYLDVVSDGNTETYFLYTDPSIKVKAMMDWEVLYKLFPDSSYEELKAVKTVGNLIVSASKR